MLAIKDDKGRWREWHINESFHGVLGRVVQFQADGDELNFLLTCMEKVNYDKQSGAVSLQQNELYEAAKEYFKWNESEYQRNEALSLRLKKALGL